MRLRDPLVHLISRDIPVFVLRFQNFNFKLQRIQRKASATISRMKIKELK